MKNWMNKLPNVSGLLHSKSVLYFLVIIAIINMITYASTNEPTYAGFMLLIGFLTSFFSKNMIVIIFVAVAFTNIIRFGMESASQYREGFDMNNLAQLTQHLSGQPDSSKETNASSTDEPASMEEAKIKATGVLDSKLDELIQSLDSNGMMEQMDKSLDETQIQTAKDKLNEALVHMDKIPNEQQRIKITNLLNAQIKMLEYLSGISPLVGEFKSALNAIKK
jgi:hypothetical protein